MKKNNTSKHKIYERNPKLRYQMLGSESPDKFVGQIMNIKRKKQSNSHCKKHVEVILKK